MKDEKYGAGKVLLAIQNEISVTKDNTNDFSGWSYRSLDDILVKLKPILQKHNATIYLTDDVRSVGDYTFVQARAVFMVLGHDDMKLTTQAQAGIGPMKGTNVSQQFGAASSYARKYALAGMLLLDDNKDADTQDTRDLEETAKEIIDNGDFL
jgi:hypothetical protein